MAKEKRFTGFASRIATGSSTLVGVLGILSMISHEWALGSYFGRFGAAVLISLGTLLGAFVSAYVVSALGKKGVKEEKD